MAFVFLPHCAPSTHTSASSKHNVISCTAPRISRVSDVEAKRVREASSSFFAGDLEVTRGRCFVLGMPTKVFQCTPTIFAHGPSSAPAGHGNGAVNGDRRPGSHKGFIEEMRFVAMKLHTKDQSKEGMQQESTIPFSEWRPRKEDYLQFLVDSKLVYDAMESIVAESEHPEYALFKNTGIERSESLAKDIEWFKSEGVAVPEPGPSGIEYATLLKKLAHKDPPAFICHFYNVYFAHSAGGRMIGQKVSDLVLDGRVLNFYKWDGDLKQLLQAVKDNIDEVATGWTREQKDHCLEETEKSFKYSGQILSNLAKTAAPS